jgi:prophage antirepressor-like protein
VNDLQVFSYEGNEVRTIQQDGETWWIAKDVCDVFGETNRNRAMQGLADDEKGYTQMTTPGGVQNLAIINESGLYSLLFAMQPQKARGMSDEYVQNRIEQLRAFRRWVTHEVLPSIRKHGAYLTPAKLEEMLNDPDAWIKMLTTLKEEREAHALTAQRLEEKTLQLDESKEWFTVKRVASINRRPWQSFDWRRLKNTSAYLGYPVQKVFDANYGEVNAYHIDVWKHEYAGMNFECKEVGA